MVNYKAADTLISREKLLDKENYRTYAETREVFSLPCIGLCNDKSLQLEVAPGDFLYIPMEFVSESFNMGDGKGIEAIKCVGKDIEFIFRIQGDEVIPSRLDAMVEAKKRLMKYPIGTVIYGRVVSLAPFGAFVDIGSGTIGLLPIRLQAVGHTAHDAQRFDVGDEIPVVLYAKDRGRFTLTTIPVLGTFDQNIEALEDYSTVIGVVRSVKDYGAFIEVTPNLVGLSGEEGLSYKPGDKVSVCIRNIRPEKSKLRLIVIDKVPNYTPPTIPYQWHTPQGAMLSYWQYNTNDPNDKLIFDFEGGVMYGL